jgi:hypothetical protein
MLPAAAPALPTEKANAEPPPLLEPLLNANRDGD